MSVQMSSASMPLLPAGGCLRSRHRQVGAPSGWRTIQTYATFFIVSALAMAASCAPPSDLAAADTADGELLLIPSSLKTCTQALGDNGKSDEEKLLMCQLYESSALLAQLSALVNKGLDRLIVNEVISSATNGQPEVGSGWEPTSGQRERRKHEYLRFGKRKHEYIQFGKRKHEYLRFG